MLVEDGFALEAAAKSLTYVFEQLAIGVVVVRYLHLGAVSGTPTADFERWLRRMARVASSLLLASICLRLWAHTAAAFGTADAWRSENLELIALQSRWGRGWRVQALSIVASCGAAILLSWHRVAWIAFGLCAAVLATAMPLLGHAGGNPVRHILHAAHNLAAAGWIGTLLVITLYACRRHDVSGAFDIVTALVRRFSPVALTAATVVGFTGTIAAALYLGSLAALWTSTYGQRLLIKLALVSVVAACGWRNWRAVRTGRRPALSLLIIESVAATLAVCATGALSETAHP